MVSRAPQLFCPLLGLALLSACGPTLDGRRYVDEVPEAVRDSGYECIEMKYVLLDGPGKLQAWAVPYDNAGTQQKRPYELTHHLRDEQGDHFLSWRGNPPEGAIEFMAPRDRHLSARLTGFSGPKLRLATQKGQVVGFTGEADNHWTCWSRTPERE